jgi:hypothetical protein
LLKLSAAIVIAGLAAAAAVTGCAGSGTPAAGHPAAVATTSPPASASPPPSVAVPHTAAAAKSAAEAYFDLYAAGQYPAVYPMIDPADRAQISEPVWVGLHYACRNRASAGRTYQVTHPVLAGSTAVVSVGFAGATALGSEQVTFAYTGGHWYYKPSDLSVYAHHDLAEAVAALKAEGQC